MKILIYRMLIKPSLLLLILLFSSAHAEEDLDRFKPETLRILQNDQRLSGGQIHSPALMSGAEMMDLWHLSEGSDIFPLQWLVTMKSFASNRPATKLSEDLDIKFNVLKDHRELTHTPSTFALDWIGLGAAWSDSPPASADVKLAPGQSLAQILSSPPLGRGHVAMIGVNCAFCHSNEMQFSQRKLFLNGGPAMVDLRGFFVDLITSLTYTMLDPEILKSFLKDNGGQGSDSEISRRAQSFVTNFKNELRLNPNIFTQWMGQIGRVIDKSFIDKKTQQAVYQALFEHREVTAKYLISLLKMTMNLDEVSPELVARMQFLATTIGYDPNLETTFETYSSIDTFGRIGNGLVRKRHPIPYTALASFPPLWGLEYQAQFHWDANTNSPILRNIGQAFGLGAVLTGNQSEGLAFNSTVNVENLAKLESITYKIDYPSWVDTGEPLDLNKVKRGCYLYYNTCVKCHGTPSERVGPQKSLVETFLPPRDLVGTDPIYLQNITTPVEGVPFMTALPNLLRKVRDSFFERNQIPYATQQQWGHFDLRGPDAFRDTPLGASDFSGELNYMNVSASSGYGARSLAGVWATAPYLHNGSVPNLYELLRPANQRPPVFFLGSRKFDSIKLGYFSSLEENIPESAETITQAAIQLMHAQPGLLSELFGVTILTPPSEIHVAKRLAACNLHPERCYITARTGNGNQGHEGPLYGTAWNDEERFDLIEFIKVLRPPVEYSQNRNPVYSWDGQRCEIVNAAPL